MISKQNLRKIKAIGIRIDHEMAFGGKSRGNRHLRRAVKIADHLAKKTGADRRVVEAGAWLHDTALPSGNDYYYRKNKRIAKKLLFPVPISKADKDRVAACVASHEGTGPSKTLEAKVVHDADVLEKLGPLGIIRHTWKMTNSDQIHPKMVRDQDVEKVLGHIGWRRKKLQTAPAKDIGKYLTGAISKRDARKIVTLASEMAARGVITEKIAQALYKHLGKKQAGKLKEQLDLGYLHKFK